MKKFLLLLLVLGTLACDNTTRQIPEARAATILPVPKRVDLQDQTLLLSRESKFYSPDPDMTPLFEVLSYQFGRVSNLEPSIAATEDASADLIFRLDPALEGEAYRIDINDRVEVRGANYTALARAGQVLVQLMGMEKNEGALPVGTIEDRPDVAYRGLMIDLARQWHDLRTLRRLINMAAFYGVNYLHLHFTDYQSYTLPSDYLPKLPTPERHYSKDDIRNLVEYARTRGVTIVPEIDIPGHSSPFVEQYPEIFAIRDTSDNPWIINMGREAAYVALDSIITEAIALFPNSPYFHIGGDEAIFTAVDRDPDVRAYMQANDLGDDVHDLYRHFLVRMNEIVKRNGKQMCVWEGFRPEGTVEIPKDILVFEFETNRYLPQELVRDGYQVVNTSWKPLYVVNKKKWEPAVIYDWNLWNWGNWWPKAPSYEPIQLDETPLVVGAQMCSWEQAGEVEIPSLRKRLPAFVERVWNVEQQIPYDSFEVRMNQLDERLTRLIRDGRQDSLLVGYNWVAEE